MTVTENNHIPVFIFSWVDYTIFAITILLSVAIGIYFGMFRKKQTTQEYLLAGRSMNYFIIALSLISSEISGISILAIPTDVYKFGSNYIWMCLAIVLACIITYYVYLPVFFDLQLRSMYQYFSIRFDNKIRLLSAFFYIIGKAFFNAILIYLPVVAFAQTTSFNIHVVLYLIGFSCIFYTAIGGVKGVIWSDFFQFFGMIGGIVAVLSLGIATAGGLETVWRKSAESGRLDVLDFSLNPTIRDGFWPLIIGGSAKCLAILCCSQEPMQKYLSVSSLASAKKVLVVQCVGVAAMSLLAVLLGNTIYSQYSDCDPLSSQQIKFADQLVPHFVIQTTGHIAGLPGLFTAGILSASLSSFSTSLNSVACVIYQDFLLPFILKNPTERRASNILKLIVIIFGTVCICLVYLIQNVNGIFPLINTVQALSTGPLAGLFTLGLLFPSANSKGALVGGIAGLIFATWVSIGMNHYKNFNLNTSFAKPISVSGCSFNFSRAANVTFSSSEEVFFLYRMSIWYNYPLNALVVIVVGVLVSWITRKQNHTVDSKLLSPIVRCPLKKSAIEEDESEYPLKIHNTLESK